MCPKTLYLWRINVSVSFKAFRAATNYSLFSLAINLLKIMKKKTILISLRQQYETQRYSVYCHWQREIARRIREYLVYLA